MKILGAFLIALPFISMAIFLFKAGGWRFVLIVLGGAFVIAAIIRAGVYLLEY